MDIKRIWNNWIVRNVVLAVAAVLVVVTLVSVFVNRGCTDTPTHAVVSGKSMRISREPRRPGA